jgi:hypothetical protein
LISTIELAEDVRPDRNPNDGDNKAVNEYLARGQGCYRCLVLVEEKIFGAKVKH